MTDETRKLFDAPWEVCLEKRGSFYRPCICSSDTKIASVCTKENANRLARLPELYDALAEATRRYCGICHNLSGQDEPKIEDLIKNGCPKAQYKNRAYVVSCVALGWIDLLKKVRDGE